MSGPTVALVTCAAHPELPPDDRLLLPALAAAGLDPVPRRWDTPGEPWERHAAVVLRSPWDYHLRIAEFHGWLERLDAGRVRLFNPLPLVRWNADKRYLRDLEAAGVAVVPTHWVARGSSTTLADAKEQTGWRDIVVKPSVSATAWETWRVGPDVGPEDEERFARLLGRGTVMIQPYLDGIEGAELSLVFVAGRYSHAVLKRPRPGDFRVQTDFGGTVEAADPDPAVVAQAARALDAAPGASLYARVDGCVIDGRLRLMELELIEPVLFFGHQPAAAGHFAAALRSAIALAADGPR
jgi:glutathione synthase/RimK-type ligase-like ATP-grasp enzyme